MSHATVRGHGLSYAGLLLFTLILYLRPNDFLPIGDFPVAKIVALAALTVFLFERFAYGRPLSLLPRELKYLLVFLAMMFLSVPLALEPGEALDTILGVFIKVVLVFVLLINVVISYARLRQVMALTVLCGGGIAVGTLRSFLAGENLVATYRASGVGSGMFQNPNDLALALAMLIPLAVGLALTAKAFPGKVVYLASAGVMAAATITTYSRAGFLSLIACTTYMLGAVARRHRQAGLWAACAGLALVIFAPPDYGLRVLSIFDTSLDPVSSATARADVLTRSLQVAAFNPKVWAVGVGVANFHIVSVHELVNHNAYLEVLTEIGLPAFVLYLLFLASAFRGLRLIARSSVRRGDHEALSLTAIAIRASLVAYLVGSFFASVAYLWYLYYPAGYAVCLRQIAAAARATNGAPHEREVPTVVERPTPHTLRA